MAHSHFGQTIAQILEHFQDSRAWPYRIGFYKNVPVSHIRINNPKRNYIRYHSYYQDLFSTLDLPHVAKLLALLKNMLETNEFFTVQGEQRLLKNLEEQILPEEDIVILKHIMELIKIMVFSDDLDEHGKFRDPVVVSTGPNDRLIIHPGRKRVNVLEYLHQKHKKEYYVDVIYYKHKDADNSDNIDGFLIDRDHTVIKTLQNFVEVYNYPTVEKFLIDLSHKKIGFFMDERKQCYINKYTSYQKENFIKKFASILIMCQK